MRASRQLHRPWQLAACLLLACGGDDDGPAAGPDAAPAACPVAPSDDPLIVATTHGLVRGERAGEVRVFRGVPYAAPPIGPLRFRPTAPPACWADVRDARSYGPSCPQRGADLDTLIGDEDCLTLNVWTPTDAVDAARPVLFWIHGGANLAGGANQEIAGRNLYDGQALARAQDVVVVSLNYRLGALGFLAHPALGADDPQGTSGNYGLLDQIAALDWVQANVARFGGDPARVMVFGESAGAFDTCAILASPLAAGRFSAALMESGVCDAPTLASSERMGLDVAARAGCPGDGADVARCLREASPGALVGADPSTLFSVAVPAPPLDPARMLSALIVFGPTVDGRVLPRAPIDALAAGSHSHVPFAIGTTANEMDLFIPVGTIPTCGAYRERLAGHFGAARAARIEALYPCTSFLTARLTYADAMTDVGFTCPSRRAARAAEAGQDEPVHRYFFSHVRALGPLRALRAYHSAELPFVFDALGGAADPASPAELELADAVGGYWARFAATGSPDGAGAPAWLPTGPGGDSALELRAGAIGMLDGVQTERCDLWDALAAGT